MGTNPAATGVVVSSRIQSGYIDSLITSMEEHEAMIQALTGSDFGRLEEDLKLN